MTKIAQQAPGAAKQQVDNMKRDEATRNQVDHFVVQIKNDCKNAIGIIKVIAQAIQVLSTDTAYASPDNFNTAQVYLRKLLQFQQFLEGAAVKELQNVGPLKMIPAPSPDDTQGTAVYKNLNAKHDQLKALLAGRIIPAMKQSSVLIGQAQQGNQDWSKVEPYKTTKLSYDNAITAANNLGFTKILAASIRTAYPMSYTWQPKPKPVDVKQWKTLAAQIKAFSRAYPTYTFPQVLYHFTKSWNMFDRYKFKNWYKWMYRTAGAKQMEKRALAGDMIDQDRVLKFEKKRKLLLSRIDLVKKALRDLINNSLVDGAVGEKIYRILAMLDYEAMKIKAPKIAAARVRRAGTQLRKLGFAEGSQILFAAAQEFTSPGPIVKTAQEREENEEKESRGNKEPAKVADILRRIKGQMDKLNYNKHLDELYHIKKELEEMGRSSDADAMLKIIRDDLDTLDKLNKKLTDVYTSLSRVPIELTEEQDRKMAPPTEKAKEMPLEVKEEKAPELEVSEEELPEVKKAPAPAGPRPGRATPPARPAAPALPRVQTEIPNV